MAQRALLVPSAVGLSHLGRLLLVANELVRDGVELTFAYGGSRSDWIAAAGHPNVPIADLTTTDFGRNVFASLDEALARRSLDDLQAAIDRVAPQVVITDFQPVACLAAELAGVPSVSVLNAYLTPYFDVVGLVSSASRRGILPKLGRRFVVVARSVRLHALATPLRRLARRSGAPHRTNLFDFFEGDLNLIADLPQLVPTHGLPPQHRYVGPLIWEPPVDDDDPTPVAPGVDRTVIYVTVGNTGSARLLDVAATTLSGRENVLVEMTTGAYHDPAAYRNYPGIRARRFSSGSRILERCTLAVHCGGNGTTYQCLAAGVPMVVIPFNADQQINAALIHREKVGIALDPRNLTASILGAAVHAAQSDEFRENARRFQAHCAALRGPRRAADAIAGHLAQPITSGEAHEDRGLV